MILQDPKQLEPYEILEKAIAKGLSDFYVGYSGGKDSGTVLNIVAGFAPENFKGVLFCDTGIGTIETKKFVIENCKKKNYPLHILKPTNVLICDTCHKSLNRTKNFDAKICPICKNKGTPLSYEKAVLRWGFPSAYSHPQTMAWLKWHSIVQFLLKKEALGEKPAFMSGIRKKESKKRNKNFKHWHDKTDRINFVKPIFYKDNNWVMKYVIENNIKRSPVYETLHRSGDCLCGCFGQTQDLKLIQMFHPDAFNEIRRLEELIKKEGTPNAKKFGLWGNTRKDTWGTSTNDIIAQTNLENFICNDCILDNKSTSADNKRFNDEFDDIETKLESLNA
tara:strand:- start:20 stop:1024 length:1005 start_codon:yes stop_codon:yes gene_type:complete